MQNILNKKAIKPSSGAKSQETKSITFDDILSFYETKNKNLFGLEYERLALDKTTLKNASYEQVSKIIENLSSILNWQIIYDNETIIGAKGPDGTSASMEPGMQFEISLTPMKSILDMDLKLSKIVELTNKIASAYNVILLGYGISPVSGVDEINILNKKRYDLMNRYLPYCDRGELCPVMMRKTAGIQINVDYSDSYDCYNKLKFFNMIMPFMMALSANSPFENGVLSQNKSNRANAWLNTGANRCNLFYKKVFQGFNKQKNIIKNYVQEILKVPMLYIERDEKIIEINGKIDFAAYLKEGYQGYRPALKDYILHQSLIFPDIRLKNYIEIRNHDSLNPELALALAAFYKGLCYCDFDNLLEIFSFIKLDELENINKEIISKGLDIKIKDRGKEISGWNIIKMLFLISLKNLNAKDRIYMTPIEKLIALKKTTADFIINYEINTASDLIEFLS